MAALVGFFFFHGSERALPHMYACASPPSGPHCRRSQTDFALQAIVECRAAKAK